jgi:hypothetical protein
MCLRSPPNMYLREQTVPEQGSLYSMRSHASPHSARGRLESVPASDSNSPHSRGLTGSILKCLAHSSSMSSTDRHFARHSPVEGPPLFVPGHHFPSPPPFRDLPTWPRAARSCTADRIDRDGYIHDNARQRDDTHVVDGSGCW